MGEGEVGEAASDRCQSVTRLGKGRAGHGLGTGTGGTGHRLGTITGGTRHELGTSLGRHGTGELGTGGLGRGGLCPNVMGTH